MTVLSVTEKRRRSSFKPPADREHTIEYTVLCSLRQEDPKTVKSHGSIPQEGTACPFDSGAVCKTVSAEQDEEAPTVWSVECTFTTETLPGMAVDQGGSTHLGPLSMPPVFRFGTVKVAEARYEDRGFKAYKDSAGTPIEGVELEISHQVMVVSHNEGEYDPITENFYLDQINWGPWLGFPAKSVRYTDVSAEEAFEENIRFWRVTRTFEYNPDLWDPIKRLDAGPKYKNDSGKLIVAADDNGVTHDGRVFLDGTGKKLAQAAIDDGQYHWIEFHDYRANDFTKLNLYK